MLIISEQPAVKITAGIVSDIMSKSNFREDLCLEEIVNGVWRYRKTLIVDHNANAVLAVVHTERSAKLDLFCKKSDTAKQYIQKWMPIVAASQSVKGKKEEREFLLNWVNVVEYD